MSSLAPWLAPPARMLQRLRRLGGLANAAAGSEGHWQNTTLAVIDQAVVSGTNFATSLFLASCGAAELGVYYLALSLLNLARGVQEQIIVAPYIVYRQRRLADAGRFAGSLLAHHLIFTASAGLVLFAVWLTGWQPTTWASAALTLAGIAPLYLLREVLRQVSFAHFHMGRALTLDVLTAAVQLGLLAALAGMGLLSVHLAWTAIAAACGMGALAWLLTKRVEFHCQKAAIMADWHSNWRFGRWALASQLLACSAPYIVPWVVAAGHSEAETGLLGACLTVVGFSKIFLLGISNYLTPLAARAFARGGTGELKGILAKSAILFLATLGPAAIAAFALGGWLVEALYGPGFRGCGPIIGCLSLAVLVNGMGVAAGNGLCAMDRPSANFRADLIAMGVSLAAMAVLIPWLGSLGAALSILATVCCDAAIRAWTLRTVLTKQDRPAAEGGAAP